MSARRHAKENFATTGGTPTTTALATLVTALRAADASTRGIPVDDARGVTVVASCPSGQTITSGILRAYAYLPVDRSNDGSIPTAGRRWVRYPNLDVDLIADTGVTTATERDIPIGDKMVLSGVGRLAYLPDACIHSGSADATGFVFTYSMNWRNMS
jgi:hypothetical protein